MERARKENDSHQSGTSRRVAQARTSRSSPQKDLASGIDNSPFMVAQRKKLQSLFGGAAQLQDEPISKPNNTGLPDNLKSGIESLSGMSMDHVKVHYNSSQPAQLNALAYAQGSDIHVAPGQEKHLPHEAWHVVQQAQGRVKPTMQMKSGVAVNDDAGLEIEANAMGARIAQAAETSRSQFQYAHGLGKFSGKGFGPIVQRTVSFLGDGLKNPWEEVKPKAGDLQKLEEDKNVRLSFTVDGNVDRGSAWTNLAQFDGSTPQALHGYMMGKPIIEVHIGPWNSANELLETMLHECLLHVLKKYEFIRKAKRIFSKMDAPETSEKDQEVLLEKLNELKNKAMDVGREHKSRRAWTRVLKAARKLHCLDEAKLDCQREHHLGRETTDELVGRLTREEEEKRRKKERKKEKQRKKKRKREGDDETGNKNKRAKHNDS